MKYPIILSVLLVFISGNLLAQDEIQFELDFHWKDTTLVPSFQYENTYNEVWGFQQDGIEYGIIGSTFGHHFFNLSTGAVEPIHEVQGGNSSGGVIHRDYHDYKGYLYAVCDEGVGPSKLQIFDLKQLPDSAAVVYDSNELFSTAHNIFIDTSSARLYAGAGTTTMFDNFHLKVFDISEPLNPQLLLTWTQADFFNAHDLYVRNDTAYLNAEENGLLIVDFSNIEDVKTLGWLQNYGSFGQGYNHSGWLTDDGKHYVMADENHSLKLKMVNVEDKEDLFVESIFGVEADDSLDIAHNQMIIGDYLYVSYYSDGMIVYNIANIDSIYVAGQFSTTEESRTDSYRGNWGVYCYLPSNKILLSDMQEGFYVLNATYPEPEPVISGIEDIQNNKVIVYPNPVNDVFELSWEGEKAPQAIRLLDTKGRTLRQWENVSSQNKRQLQIPPGLPTGLYLLTFAIDGSEKSLPILVE